MIAYPSCPRCAEEQEKIRRAQDYHDLRSEAVHRRILAAHLRKEHKPERVEVAPGVVWEVRE